MAGTEIVCRAWAPRAPWVAGPCLGRGTEVGVLGECPGAFPRVLVSSSLQAENQGADMLLGRAGRPPHPSLTQQVPPWQEEVSSRRAGEGVR